MSTAVATTGQHTRGGSRVLAHVQKPQTTHTHATHTNNSYDQTQETIHNKKPQTREIAGVPPARACSARSEYFADVVWRHADSRLSAVPRANWQLNCKLLATCGCTRAQVEP